MKITTTENTLIKLANPEFIPQRKIQLNRNELKTLDKAYRILLEADRLFTAIHPDVDSRDNPYLCTWVELSYCFPDDYEREK